LCNTKVLQHTIVCCKTQYYGIACAIGIMLNQMRRVIGSGPPCWQTHLVIFRYRDMYKTASDEKEGVGSKIMNAFTRLAYSGDCLQDIMAVIVWCKALVSGARDRASITARAEGSLLTFIREVDSLKTGIFLCARAPTPPSVADGLRKSLEHARAVALGGFFSLRQISASVAEAGNSSVKAQGNRRGKGLAVPSARA
jgi:hypothetical protein